MYGVKRIQHTNVQPSSQKWSMVKEALWFGAATSGMLAVVEGNIISKFENMKNLQNNLKVAVCELKLRRSYVMHQDNNPKHWSNIYYRMV